MDEVSLLRFEAVESRIYELKRHDQEIVNSLNTMLENLKVINSNMERVMNVSEKISEKIRLLELDLQERNVKKRMFKFFLSFYPVLMILIILMMDSDHHKISMIATDINDIVQQVGQVYVYSKNDDD